MGWLAEVVVGFWSIPVVLGCVLLFIFTLSQHCKIFSIAFLGIQPNTEKKNHFP